MNPDDFVKRRVAIHVAYLGTNYLGSQWQGALTTPGVVPTVEAALEAALTKVGAIAPHNAGDISKVGWSRSSRTDKGVHSLGTVVSMKMRLHPQWLSVRGDLDPVYANKLTDAINDALPTDIRVLCVQRTPKQFQPRRACRVRTYAYVIPSWVMRSSTERSDDVSLPPDNATVDRFRSALQALEGSHPFHNFTSRSVYVNNRHKRQDSSRRSRHAAKAAAAAAAAAAEVRMESGEKVELESGWKQVDNDGGESEDIDPDDTDDEQMQPWELAAAGSASGELAGWYETRYVEDGVEGADPVTPEHWRRVLSFTVEKIDVDSVNGQSFVRVRVSGESFLLNQIRRMIGLAVSVARNDVPLSYLEAALAGPTRLYTPISPSHTLYLHSNAFNPFRSGDGNEKKKDRKVLDLTQTGVTIRGEFAKAELAPAMRTSLAHEDWERFDKMLRVFAAFYRDEWAGGADRPEPEQKRYVGVGWAPLMTVVERGQSWRVSRDEEKKRQEERRLNREREREEERRILLREKSEAKREEQRKRNDE